MDIGGLEFAMTKVGPKKPGGSSLAGAQTSNREELSSDERAEVLLGGVFANAFTACQFAEKGLGSIDGLAAYRTYQKRIGRVRAGDLSDLESLLVAHAYTLDSIFGALCRKGVAALTHDPEGAERLFRVALKAQSQSRATAEAISGLKHPTVFVRQANVVHQGQQQVVNNLGPGAATVNRRKKLGNPPNEVLEAPEGALNGEQQRLVSGAESSAIGGDPAMAPLGAVHRAEN